MARRNDVRKTAANINSQWLKNTLKSMGVASTEVIKDMMPATSSTISTTASAVTQTVKSLTSGKSNARKIGAALSKNPVVQMAKDGLRNALDDVKSGNLYNTERSGMEDDIDTMFGDLDSMFDDEPAGGDVNIENNTIVQNDASGATLKAIQKQSEYQLKASQATIDTMVSVASVNMMENAKLGSQILDQLGTINANIAAMVEYQNTNVTKFINASIGYYEQMAKKAEADSSSSSGVSGSSVIGSGGGLDFGNYREYVKQNIKKMGSESTVGSMAAMILENKDMLIANPIGGIMTTVMKAAIPSVMKASMEALDNTVKDFIPVMLQRISDLGNSTDSSMFGGITRMIGKVFGVNTERKKDIDTTKIEKGPVPYNGVANHTIVEIIPKYLRESNAYLREIAQAVTGKSDDEMKKGVTGFDWEKGKFRNSDEMRDEIYQQIMDSVSYKFERSVGGKKLSSYREALTKDTDKAAYDSALKQVYARMEQHEGEVNFNDPSHMTEILNIQAPKLIKKAIEAAINDMQKNNDSGIGSLKAAAIQAKVQRNQMLQSLEDGMGSNNAHQIADGATYDEWISRGASLAKGGKTPGSIKSLPSLVSDIYTLLQRGIKVRTVKRLGKLPGASTDASVDTDDDREPSKSDLRKLQNNIDNIGSENDDLQPFDTSTGSIRQRAGNAAANGMNMFRGLLNGIMTGNADAAWDGFVNSMKGVFQKAGSFMSEHFFTPMKNALFGEKDENGYLSGGLFEGVNNKMKESFFSLRRMITGKGYTAADGTQVADATEEEMGNTVIGKLKGMANTVMDSIKARLFGSDEEDEEGNKKEGIFGKFKGGLGKATSSLLQGLAGWKTALFGKGSDNEDDEEVGKATWEDIKKKAKDVLPSALAGSVIGAGGGLAAGGLLGTLVGGPIGGALLGFAGGILAKSDKFKNWLFGAEDENGERTGGVISKKVQDYFKKNGKFLAGGAAIGAIKGMFTGGGLLGTLVGGPIGGALMGMGTSMLIKSDTFQKFLFGDEEAGQLGIVNHVKRWIGGFGKSKLTGDADGGKLAGMMALGTAGGGLLGMLVGGPVVGSILGLGASILAQKDNFHEWLFGKTDEDGNKKEGIIGQFGNMLKVNVFRPVGDMFKDIGSDFKDFIKFDVLGRFNLVFESLGDSIFGGIRKITGTAMASLSDFGNYIKENFLKGIVDKAQAVLKPLTAGVTTAVKGVYEVGKKILAAPITILHSITSPIAKAVGNVVTGVATTAMKGIDLLLVKPIKNLVLKPLGMVTKGLGKVIAAPFKLLGNVVTGITDRITAFTTHVSNFVSELGSRIGKTIAKPFVAAGEKVKEVGARIGSVMKDAFITPITDFAKSTLSLIGDHIKQTTSKFFKQALHVLNPVTWIKGGINMGKKALALLRGEDPNEVDNRPKKKSKLRELWEATAPGEYKPDRSHTFVRDENGNIIDSKLSLAQRRKNLEQDRKNAKIARAKESQERKNLNYNEKLIAKYTGNQRADFTEENKKLAEYEAKKKGVTINWKEAQVRETEAEKRDKKQTEAAETTAENTTKLAKLADFLMGRKTGETAQNIQEKASEMGEKMGTDLKRSRDQINERRAKAEGYHQKMDIEIDEAIHNRMRKKQSKEAQKFSAEATRGMSFGNALKTNWNLFKGRVKGAWNGNYDVDAHADGTEGAKPGPAIVGENGVEAVYSKGAKRGRLVGVGGPEVINMKGGEKVIPNHRINAYAEGTDDQGLSKMDDGDLLNATDTTKLTIGERMVRGLHEIKNAILSSGIGGGLAGIFGGHNIAEASADATVSDMNLAAAEATEGTKDDQLANLADDKAAQASVTTLTGDFMRAKNANIKEENEDDARQDAMLKALQGIQGEQKKQGFEWSSIFSKKGLITAGLLLLIPWLKNMLGKLLGALGAGASDLIKDTIWTSENAARTDGNTMGEQAAYEASQIASGNLLGFDEEGNARAVTEPRAKLLARTVMNFKNSRHTGPFSSKVTRAEKKFFNKVKDVGTGIKNFATKSPYEKAMALSDDGYTSAKRFGPNKGQVKSIITSDDWATLAAENGDDWAKANKKHYRVKSDKSLTERVKGAFSKKTATNVADDAASVADDVAVKGGSKLKNAAKVVKETVVNKAAKDDGIISKLCGYVTQFFTMLAEKFGKKAGKEGGESVLKKVSSGLLKGVKGLTDDICTKLAAKISAITGAKVTAASVSFGISEAVFATIGAVNGISGTAKLFNVKSDKVDGTMRLIAGIFGGFTGTTIGSIIDVIVSVVGAIVGCDFLNSAAVALYNLMVGTGSEKAKALEAAQDEWHDTYLAERDSTLQKQYETQKAAGIIGEDVTYEVWYQGLLDGKYSADYESFADWNTKENASLGDKALSMLGKGWKGLTKGAKAGWGAVFGSTVETGVDKNGNTYTKNDDGTYQVTSADGKDLGFIAKDALPEDVEIRKDKKDGLIQKAGKGIAKGFNKIKEAWNKQGIGEKIGTIAGTIGGPLGMAVGKVIGKAADWLIGSKQEIFRASDGTYYTKDGKHYSGADDLLDDTLTPDEVAAKVGIGELVRETITVKPKSFKEALSNAGANIKTAWNNATTAISEKWNSLKQKAGEFKDKVVGGLKKAATATKNFFVSDSVTGYRATDGSYYDAAGKHFSAAGDELGDSISLVELSEKINSGELVQDRIVTRQSGIVKLAENIKNGWNSFWEGAANLGKKVLDSGKAFFSKVGKGIAKAATATKNFFAAHTGKAFFATDGSYYDASGIHYNAAGEKIGDDITADEVKSMTESGELTPGEAQVSSGIKQGLKKFTDNVKSGWNSFWTGAKDLGAKILNKGKEFGAKVVDGIKKAATATKNFFAAHTGEAFFATDGSYYDASGKHFNGAGEPIGGDITADEVKSMTDSGELTPGEARVSSGIKQGLKKMGDNIKSGWNTFITKGSELLNNMKDKVVSGYNKAKDAVKNGLTKTRNFFMSHTEKRWHSTEGGYYQSNGSTFDYYNENGDKIAEGITAEEFEALCTKGIVTADNAEEVTVNSVIGSKFKELSSIVGDTFGGIIDSGKEMWGKIKETGSKVFNDIKEQGLGKWIGGLFTKQTKKVWFDTDGNYYEVGSDGKYVKKNVNGDELEKGIAPEKVEEMAQAGLLTLGDKIEDSAAQKAIKDIKSSVKEAWDKAKDTVKNGWDKFKSWITGGDGVGSRVANQKKNVSGGHGRGMSSGFGGGFGDETLNGMTYYSQNDPRWANAKYVRSDGVDDGSTMATSGCGPTAMAMVLSDMQRGNTTPTELGRLAQATGWRDDTGTNWNFIDTASAAYGVDTVRNTNPSAQYIYDNLAAGNKMILSGQDFGVGSKSAYTDAGHYVVATGVDASGNVTYSDPRGRSYSGTIDIDTLTDETGAAWAFGGNGTKSTKRRRHRGGFGLFKRMVRGGRGDRDKWISIVRACKKAIAAKNVGYSQSNWITIEIDGVQKKHRTDCSGFVQVCLRYFGVLDDNQNLYTGNMTSMSGPMGKTGFSLRNFTSWEDLTEGDIIVRNGHTEIFAKIENGKHYVYNCGSNSSCNSPDPTISGYSTYEQVWSPGGAGSNSVSGTDYTTDSGATAQASNTYESKVTTALSGFATKAFNDIITGNTDDRNWDEALGGNGRGTGRRRRGGRGLDLDKIAEATQYMGNFANAAWDSVLLGQMNTDWDSILSGNSNSATADAGGGSSIDVGSYTLDSKNINSGLMSEIIKKTFEITNGAEGGYDTVIPNDNGSWSVGIAGFHGDAKIRPLFNEMAGKLSGTAKTQAQKFAGWGGKILTSSEAAEVKAFLNANKAVSKEVQDKHLAQVVANNISTPVKMYDAGELKDYRSIILAGDIGNTGPAHLTGWRSAYKPTNKAAELAHVKDSLRSTDSWWGRQSNTKNSRYYNGWMNRINNTYNALKGWSAPGYGGEGGGRGTGPKIATRRYGGFGAVDNIEPITGMPVRTSISADMGDANRRIVRYATSNNPMGGVEDLLVEVISTLTTIAQNSGNLSLLRDIKQGISNIRTGSVTQNTIVGVKGQPTGGHGTGPKTSITGGATNVSPSYNAKGMSEAEKAARSIAFGS